MDVYKQKEWTLHDCFLAVINRSETIKISRAIVLAHGFYAEDVCFKGH